MQPEQALADLQDISTEVEAAVILGADGSVAAATLDEERAREVARLTRELLAAAEGIRRRTAPSVVDLEIAMRAGSVFVVRHGGRTVVATTQAEPATGLVLYDLKACLRSLEPAAGAHAA